MSSLAKNYKRRNLSFDKGKGSYLYTKRGIKFLDFVQGIAVNSLGHANPNLIKAINKQSKKLWHVSNSFIIPEGEELAKKLTKRTFADAVIFQNSGAEATEAAIKVARRYFYSIGQKKKNRILCIKNSFHGRTIAAINASGSKKMVEGFGPKVGGFDHFKFGNHKELKRKITSKTAAIMIEPIMGEGGIKVIPSWCLRELRKICNQKKILLILDEVQCGIGRSGKFFSYEYANIKPDIVPIAKGIGGGFPIGACLVSNKVAEGMKFGSHGSTFGGNPLACSVANKVVEIISKKIFLDDLNEKSIFFINELEKIKNNYTNLISEIRGSGFMIGIKSKISNSIFIEKFVNNGLLVIGASENVIRILPPLNVTKKDLNIALKKIEKTCGEINNKL